MSQNYAETTAHTLSDRNTAAGSLTRSKAPDYSHELEDCARECRRTLRAVALFRDKLFGEGEDSTKMLNPEPSQSLSLVASLEHFPGEIRALNNECRDIIAGLTETLKLNN